MSGPTPRVAGRLPAIALLLVLGFILVQQTADRLDARLVQLGESIWPGYALSLRSDPPPPDCEPEQSRQALATCVEPAPAGAPDPSADPFADPSADPFADPFADAPAAARTDGVACPAARALVEQCDVQHLAYDQARASLTSSVRAFRAVELRLRDLADFAYGLHLLSVVFILGGLVATGRRAHIALRAAHDVRGHQLDQGGQLVAHLLMAASAFADWRVRANLEIETENVEVPLLWTVGFLALAAINLRHLVRPPAGLSPGGPLLRGLLCVPLYAWMVGTAGVWFLLVEGHPSGQAIYLHKFAQIPSVYLAVALYVWGGMLLERSSVSGRVFDLIRPWGLPVPLLGWVIVVAAALPTAYSGASGIFVIAAGALVFDEMRRAGASPRQARMIAAMSGSLGVVLRPCLVVVLIASLNKEVTTSELYQSGILVFGLTALVLLLTLVAVYRPKLRLSPAPDALSSTARAAQGLLPFVLIGGLVVGGYALILDAPLNERTAPWILPVMLLLVLLWEGRGKGLGPKVEHASGHAGEHTGALLFLMAATVCLGGVVERSELMELVPHTLGSPVLAMGVLVVILVLIGMTMDAMGAVILVSVTLADVAYRHGIDPVHFWMVVLVGFELGYLTPPVALNHLLTRQVVGEAALAEPGVRGFWARNEHLWVPVVVMGISLLLVAFVPLLWG